MQKVESLKTLMSTVTFHGGKSESVVEEDVRPSSSHCTTETIDHDSGRLLAELTSALDSSDKLLSVLADIQSYSNPRPSVLIHFQGEFLYLMSHGNSQVRTVSYNLLVKHLKQRPYCWRDVMPSYIGALQSNNEAIVSSALGFLPEFSVFCQENLSLLLTTVFKLNVSDNINTTQNIINAINVVNSLGGGNT